MFTPARRFARALAVVTSLALVTAAAAHEFWIEPETFRPRVDQNIGIRLFVGDGFPGEPRPRDPRRLEKFVVAGAVWESPIPGADGEDPAGIHRFSRPGVHVLGYRSTPVQHTMEAEKFEAYLKDEGLPHIVAQRAERGESAKPGRERFSRCAKCIVSVGDPTAADTGYARTLAMPAELTPVDNPYLKTAGTEYAVRLTHEGKPAPAAVVKVFCKTRPGVVLDVTTDQDGVARFTPDTPGMWLVGNVYMRPVPPAADGSPNPEADWDSLWASLTFEVLPAAAAANTDAAKPATANTPAPPAPASAPAPVPAPASPSPR